MKNWFPYFSRTLTGSSKSVPKEAEALFKKLAVVKKSTGLESFRYRVGAALKMAGDIETERGIPANTNDPFLKNPCIVAEQAIDYGFDETTVLASILYASLRPVAKSSITPAIDYDSKYLEWIKRDFGLDVKNAVLEVLEISEINLLAKPSISETTPDLPQQNDAERLSHFVGMVEQNITKKENWLESGVRGLGIRASTWSKRLQILIASDPNIHLSAEQQIEHIRPNLYINIPILERISALARYAGREDISRQFTEIANDISFYCLQLADPVRFSAANERIEAHQRKFLSGAGKPMPSASASTRNAMIRKLLEEEILECLPEELRKLCTLECRPRKDPSSLWRKFVSKAKKGVSIQNVDASDIIALRLIVRHPNPRVYMTLDSIRNNLFLTPKERTTKLAQTKRQEAELLATVEQSILARFSTVEKRYKNFIEDPLQKGMKKVDLGYRAIHICLLINGVPVEMQLCGYAMHYDNTFGQPSHTHYKGKNALSLAVFGPENLIYNIPRGSTAADFLATLGEDFAFNADAISISRSSVFEAPENNHALDCPLLPGDKVSFVIDEGLSLSPEHRKAVMDACYIPELHEKLSIANANYPDRSVGGGASDAPRADPH